MNAKIRTRNKVLYKKIFQQGNLEKKTSMTL